MARHDTPIVHARPYQPKFNSTYDNKYLAPRPRLMANGGGQNPDYLYPSPSNTLSARPNTQSLGTPLGCTTNSLNMTNNSINIHRDMSLRELPISPAPGWMSPSIPLSSGDRISSPSPPHYSNVESRQHMRSILFNSAINFSNTPQYRELVFRHADEGGNRTRNLQREEVYREAYKELQRLDEGGELPLPIATSGAASGALTNIRSQDRSDPKNAISKLILDGESPSEISAVSDVLESPIVIKNLSPSVVSWLIKQKQRGYWHNNSSLFILCFIVALSVGSIETIWRLSHFWGSIVFIIPYFISYFIVVQPMLSFELLSGQLIREGPPIIYNRLVPGLGGLGTVIVIFCIISGCISSGRSCAEYMLYFIDVLKSRVPWKLTEEEVRLCKSFLDDKFECMRFKPICHFNVTENLCSPSTLGKAYVAYKERFHSQDINSAALDPQLAYAITATYAIAGTFQLLGLTSFTFAAAFIVILIWFLGHIQLITTMQLDGAFEYFKATMGDWKWNFLFTKSRIWTQSLRCCIYEFAIGSGVYSTIASKSRLGYDMSAESIGIGIGHVYINSLLFSSAIGLVGYYSIVLGSEPEDIAWMLEQDCSYVLLPLGFQIAENTERTLCMLYFGCCFILICSALAVQIEVIILTLQGVVIGNYSLSRIDRRILSAILCVALMGISYPLGNTNGKYIVWFLEIALGDLGRVSMVLITSLMIGWVYGYREQAEQVGAIGVLLFNFLFWAGNILATFCEMFNETVPFLIWWLVRLLSIVLASAIATVYIKRTRKLNTASVLYWLFLGNIEVMRAMMKRISPSVKAGFLPATVFWSICIKWLGPCMLSNTFADIVEELINKEDLASQIEIVPSKWKIIALIVWGICILIIIAGYILNKLFKPKSEVTLQNLPSSLYTYSWLHGLLPRSLFKEFF
ncbi:transporter, putative [Babesia microti strain RI]|uniref:Transporter, putative n=1 Tax=Babesia microti (strain RI) TaxID=1133968 RepID=A0A1R4ACJ9_BABMR|nr:transporter, putative [Babesia microti strain RI]SJK86720.1 transporter, putative [Babesia microti strain RI]|eukprot:XP_021338843.1 transporter, putative [Babesia microti strain RI]